MKETYKKIKFAHMKPSKDLQDFIRVSINHVATLLPSQSKVLTKMSRLMGEYHCNYEVIINGIRLRSTVSDRAPQQALLKAEDDIIYKITDWRIRGPPTETDLNKEQIK